MTHDDLSLELFFNTKSTEKSFSWEEDGCQIDFFSHWLSPKDADSLMNTLVSNQNWQQPKIKIFEKEHPIPRKVSWLGEASYSYSGLTHPPSPWPAALSFIKKRLEDELNQPFNGCLLNLYRDGGDNMGWHADDEKELGKEPLIASLNLGATRTFRFKAKKGVQRTPPPPTLLTHGSLLVMKGKTQQFFHHSIPKEKNAIKPRLNLTFRTLTR